jgi:hypothetical protein
MVDGTIINTGGGAGIMGMTGGYVADVANAQEVNVQISGALGESETGGATINIVPRTGGNRFAGNYFATYTRGPLDKDGNPRTGWFSANNGNFPEIQNGYPLISDWDTSAAFGGPIKRDRLWFFSVGRVWQKNAYSRQSDRIWDNANAGIWGENYKADYSTPPLNLINWTRNANVRLTYQASQRNKLNFFWDEGYTCQDPCDGSVAPWTSRDGWWSGQVHPARLMQASWTNPLTNVILLEAGLSANRQLYDFSHHRYWEPNPDIPRVIEYGSTVGWNYATNAPLNTTNFALFGIPSGPWADGIGGLAESRRLNDWRPRASFAYVTGRHNAKFGYDGGYFSNPPQQYRQHAPGVPVRYAGGDLLQRRRSSVIDLRQYGPLSSGGSVQPGAPARSHTSQDQYRVVQHRQPGWLHRFLRAGPVDGEPLHAERCHSLRPCVQQLPRLLHRGRQRAICAPPGRRDQCRAEKLLHARQGRRLLPRHHSAVGRGVGPVRQRQDLDQVEHGQVPLGCIYQRHLRRRQPRCADRQHVLQDVDRRGR